MSCTFYSMFHFIFKSTDENDETKNKKMEKKIIIKLAFPITAAAAAKVEREKDGNNQETGNY